MTFIHARNCTANLAVAEKRFSAPRAVAGACALAVSISAAAVPTTGSAAPILFDLGQIYGYTLLSEAMREDFATLRERVGNQNFAELTAGGLSSTEAPVNVWARIDGFRRESHNRNPAEMINDAEWEMNRGEFSVGADFPVEAGGGLLLLGVSGHADYVEAQGHGFAPDESHLTSMGLGLGFGAAYLPGGGFYLDLQGRVTFWDNDNDFAPRHISQGANGTSWGVSLEAGKRVDLGGGFSLSPRAQVEYTDSHFGGFTDSDGLSVRQRDSGSLVLGAGLQIEQTLLANDSLSLFADISANYDALDDSSVNINGIEFRSGMEDAWGALTLGAAKRLGGGVSAYLQGEYGSALDENFGDTPTFGAKIGVFVDF